MRYRTRVLAVALVGAATLLAGGWQDAAPAGNERAKPVHPYMMESQAVAAMRTLNAAQRAYKEQYDKFACSLKQLGSEEGNKDAAPTAAFAGLVDSSIAKGERPGYRLTLNCTESGYRSTALPLDRKLDLRAFCSDEEGVVYQALDGTAESCFRDKRKT